MKRPYRWLLSIILLANISCKTQNKMTHDSQTQPNITDHHSKKPPIQLNPSPSPGLTPSSPENSPKLLALIAGSATVAEHPSLVLRTKSVYSDFIETIVCHNHTEHSKCMQEPLAKRSFFTADKGTEPVITIEMISEAGSGDLIIHARACHNNQKIRSTNSVCGEWKTTTTKIAPSKNKKIGAKIVKVEQLSIQKENLCIPLVTSIRSYILNKKKPLKDPNKAPDFTISPSLIPKPQQRQSLEIAMQNMYLGGEESCRKLLGSVTGNKLINDLTEYLKADQKETEEIAQKLKTGKETAQQWAEGLAITTSVLVATGVVLSILNPPASLNESEQGRLRAVFNDMTTGRGRVGSGFYAVGKAFKWYSIPAVFATGVYTMLDDSGDRGFADSFVRQKVAIDTVSDSIGSTTNNILKPKDYRSDFSFLQKSGLIASRAGGLSAIGATMAGIVYAAQAKHEQQYQLIDTQITGEVDSLPGLLTILSNIGRKMKDLDEQMAQTRFTIQKNITLN